MGGLGPLQSLLCTSQLLVNPRHVESLTSPLSLSCIQELPDKPSTVLLVHCLPDTQACNYWFPHSLATVITTKTMAAKLLVFTCCPALVEVPLWWSWWEKGDSFRRTCFKLTLFLPEVIFMDKHCICIPMLDPERWNGCLWQSSLSRLTVTFWGEDLKATFLHHARSESLTPLYLDLQIDRHSFHRSYSVNDTLPPGLKRCLAKENLGLFVILEEISKDFGISVKPHWS